MDGMYEFWLASDDQGTLLLSDDATGSGRRQIASMSEFTGSRSHDEEPSQHSVPVTLEAGQSHLIGAYAKEDGGGDHLSVAWRDRGAVATYSTRPISGAPCRVLWSAGPRSHVPRSDA
jgi:hypothetical protein